MAHQNGGLCMSSSCDRPCVGSTNIWSEHLLLCSEDPRERGGGVTLGWRDAVPE